MSDSPLHLTLLVARDVATHELAASCLSGACALLGATTLALAVELAEERPPSLVVIEDGIDGAPADVVAARVRAHAPHARVMVLLASSHEEVPASLPALGPILRKPLDSASFYEAVVATLCLCTEAPPRAKRPPRRSAPTRKDKPNP